MSGGYDLLETNALLHWLRGSGVCTTIDGQFGLKTSVFRPLVCEVTLGEIEALAMSSKWGDRLMLEPFGGQKSVTVTGRRYNQPMTSEPK